MALKNIIAPRQQVQNSQSKAVAGGNVFLYQPGTTTFITSYFDSGLVTPHTNPVRLSGSGRANIWITQDCDLRVEDKNGNLILEELNANPDVVGVDQGGGLVPNGSFEIDADADNIPDGWTLVSEAGATNAIDTSQSTDGAQSFRFTSSGNGGGSLTVDDFFPVNDVDNLSVNVDMFASIATVLNIVRVEWYDISFVSISNSDIYSSTANPLAWTTQQLLATPPANARFAKLRLIGGDPSVPIAGSSWWDSVSVFYPAVVSGVFDNITIQDNQVITTNVNGDLELGPNGTGAVNISSLNPVTLADAKNSLNLGTDDPANDPHLALGLGAAGVTIIQAKATGTTAVDRLDLQPLGGECNLGQQTGADGALTQIFQDGVQRLIVDTYGMSLRGELDGDPSVPDNVEAAIFLESRDGNAYGVMGFDGGTVLELVNYADLAGITLSGMDGVVKDALFSGLPGGAASVYYDGGVKLLTMTNGIAARGDVAAASPPTTEAVTSRLVLQGLNGVSNLALIGYEGSNDLRLKSLMRGGDILGLAVTAAGTTRNVFLAQPDSGVKLYYQGTETAQVIDAASGGLEVRNTLTGGGVERVLTESDLGVAVISAIKNAGQTIAGSALSNVTNMAMTFTGDGTNAYYHFDLIVEFRSDNASYGDMQWDFVLTGAGPSLTANLNCRLYDVDTLNQLSDVIKDVSFFGNGQLTPSNPLNDQHFMITGNLQYNASVGVQKTIQLRMARTGATGNTIIASRCSMHAFKIGNV